MKQVTFIAAIFTIIAGLGFPAVRAANIPLLKESKTSLGVLSIGLDQLANLANHALVRQTAELERQANFAVPKHFQGKTINDVKLNSGRKVIALTFDDGPFPEYTNNILHILKKNNIKATFFLLGQNVRKYPERVKQIHLEGHALANHSWSHPYHKHSEAAAANELDNTAVWIQKASGGVRSVLFRPPGGFLDNGLAAYAAKQGQVVVMWSADSKDYYASTQTIINNVLSQASPGGIILLHDGGGDRKKTVAALPVIIQKLLEQGYEFVTVPELLALHDQELKQAQIQKQQQQQQQQQKAIQQPAQPVQPTQPAQQPKPIQPPVQQQPMPVESPAL